MYSCSSWHFFSFESVDLNVCKPVSPILLPKLGVITCLLTLTLALPSGHPGPETGVFTVCVFPRDRYY